MTWQAIELSSFDRPGAASATGAMTLVPEPRAILLQSAPPLTLAGMRRLQRARAVRGSAIAYKVATSRHPLRLLILSDPGKVRTPRRSGGLSRALAPGERVWPVMNAATDNQSLMGVSVTSLAQLPRPSSAQRLADFTYAPGNQPSIHKPVRRGRPGLGRPRADLRLTGHATRFRIQVRSRLSCRTGFGELRASYQPVTKRRYASSGCLYQLSYA